MHKITLKKKTVKMRLYTQQIILLYYNSVARYFHFNCVLGLVGNKCIYIHSYTCFPIGVTSSC